MDSISEFLNRLAAMAARPKEPPAPGYDVPKEIPRRLAKSRRRARVEKALKGMEAPRPRAGLTPQQWSRRRVELYRTRANRAALVAVPRAILQLTQYPDGLTWREFNARICVRCVDMLRRQPRYVAKLAPGRYGLTWEGWRLAELLG